MELPRIVAHNGANATAAQPVIRQNTIPGQSSYRGAEYGSAAHSPAHETRDRATAIAEIDLQSLLKHIENFLQKTLRTATVNFDEKNGTTILKITDKATGELIRQYPAEEIIQFAAAIDEFITTSPGLLIKVEV